MRHSSILRLALTVVLIATVSVGCSRDPNVRKQKYYESGQRYFDKGQYREAAIQYKNAIQIDSTYGNAHYQLALALLKLQQKLEEARAKRVHRQDAEREDANMHESAVYHRAVSSHFFSRRILEGLSKGIAASGFLLPRCSSR